MRASYGGADPLAEPESSDRFDKPAPRLAGEIGVEPPTARLHDRPDLVNRDRAETTGTEADDHTRTFARRSAVGQPPSGPSCLQVSDLAIRSLGNEGRSTEKGWARRPLPQSRRLTRLRGAPLLRAEIRQVPISS